jgi:hypothetical protein
MLYKSKRCELQSKAREVLLTWARAGAYRDRAIRYLRLAHLASDRNVRNRFNAIARHYRELAEIERRVANERAPHNHQSQNTINQSHSRPRHSFAFVLLAIISGATTTVSFDLAHAGDCLPAPNSPAPKGSHWYYHLNRATQQKCWYVRLKRSSLSIRRHRQRRLTLPCLQQAPGRLIPPRIVTLEAHPAQSKRLPRQYRIPFPTRHRIIRHLRSLRERLLFRPLHKNAPHPALALRPPHQPQSYGPIRRRRLLPSKCARPMRCQLTPL